MSVLIRLLDARQHPPYIQAPMSRRPLLLQAARCVEYPDYSKQRMDARATTDVQLQ